MMMACMMLVSCVDTIILPDDKTVDEDFWKSKKDVSSMVNAAYSAMTSENVMTRILLWGGFRSDELLQSSTTMELNSDVSLALKEMANVSMQTTNQFATWSEFYNVINRCNIVLSKAEAVMAEDPNYTQGDYLSDRAQMLALRSLCYFYLVRNYRDVPYIREAIMNSSQNVQVKQSSPEEVLLGCIQDLEEASKNALSARSYSVGEWRRVGWFTADGINTLLADINLWLGSVTHNPAYYQRCADLCTTVIDSKRDQHVMERSDLTSTKYFLTKAQDMYKELYVKQNAEESIFELQINNNAAVCRYYYSRELKNGSDSWVKASGIFGTTVSTVKAVNNGVFSTNDIRLYTSCFLPNATAVEYGIRKMVANSELKTATKVVSTTRNDYNKYDQNFIVYRLTDAMLIRAEALVQLSDSTNDVRLEEAFNLIRETNARAMLDPAADSIRWNDFKSYDKEAMETLVMQERLREFCFEGKRWYDLMRYGYRRMTGVNYSSTFAQQIGDNNNFEGVRLDNSMLDLMTRSRGSDATGIKAKMRGEQYLYLPIPQADINVSPSLHQNPAYKNTSEFKKTY